MPPIKEHEPALAKPDTTRGIFRLQPPVRMIRAAEYQDGGTVSCVLVDARGDSIAGGLVGYGDRYGGIYPKHCFMGAEHPRVNGAYLLPLWGIEERAFVFLVHSILIQGLTSAQIEKLGPNHWPVGSRDIVGDSGPLAMRVELRYRTLTALDHGYLMDPKDALAYFKLTPPVSLKSPVSRGSRGEFVFKAKDPTGRSIVFYFPPEADSLAVADSVGVGQGLKLPLGTNESRMTMAIAASVLDGAGAGTRAARALRSSLERWRLRILQNDRARDSTYDHGRLADLRQ